MKGILGTPKMTLGTNFGDPDDVTGDPHKFFWGPCWEILGPSGKKKKKLGTTLEFFGTFWKILGTRNFPSPEGGGGEEILVWFGFFCNLIFFFFWVNPGGFGVGFGARIKKNESAASVRF